MISLRYVWVAFGIASIAAAIFGVSRLTKATETAHGARVFAPKPQDSSRSTSATSPTSIAELKAKIKLLHQGVDLSDQEIDEALEEVVDVAQLSLPERKQRMDEAIRTHNKEAYDSAWASAHEEALSSEFAALANESVFEVAKVECRSSTCLLTATWNDYEMGSLAYEALTSTPVGLGCRLQMLPPETGAREGLVHLDCTRARRMAEGAVPMIASITGPVPMGEGDGPNAAP